MKEEILRILHSAGQNYVSGTELCKKFGVSRQAVWKNISALKEYGYEIESVANKGYRLKTVPDKLYGPEILSRLPENCICKEVQSFEKIDSTNVQAKQFAEQGHKEGLLLVAEEQVAGKGRRGRSWQSEKGTGIFMTLLLRPHIDPNKISGITLLAALAVAKAIREVCSVPAQIKWPNDVVLHKKKICGILMEMSSEENYIHYAVAGIGINVNTPAFPAGIANTASSIFLETGKKTDRCELTACILRIFSEYYRTYLEQQDLEPFLEEYNAILANRNCEVKVYHGMIEEAVAENTERGIARGINTEGALLVEMDGKIKEIVSGEVSVRGLYGYV